MSEYDLIEGNCLGAMARMDGNSVDAIVTDPPYGLKFMGREWDHGVPGTPFWKMARRVLKPGGHLLAFGGTRTFHRLGVSIEDSGFEIRDCLSWLYGTGFPKSRNIGKDLDEWQGWGTALKPAWEPIIMARKPFEGTVAANVLEHGTAALNIDATRIPTEDNLNGGAYAQSSSKDAADASAYVTGVTGKEFEQPEGRWPANVVIDDENLIGEESRFFYCAKASKKDRGEGNNHPTVKPTDLMAWLVRMIVPPGGIVLDPFAGSGSTGVAALREGFDFIGIENDHDFFQIMARRLAHNGEQP